MIDKFVCGDWNLKRGNNLTTLIGFFCCHFIIIINSILFRLRSARILLCGLSGFGAEIAKNIILSGIKSITLLDHQNVSELDFCSQFLAAQSSLGQNRATASLLRAQALNPMVEIVVDTNSVDSKVDAFFKNFDVVVLTETSSKTLIRVDNMCRENNVKFFAGDVWGMFGYSFADLQEHKFVE